jgi:hypothetical protein
MSLAPRIPRRVGMGRRWTARRHAGNSRRYLDWLKTLPCVACGCPADDPHHLLKARGIHKGLGQKNPDRWAIPVCRALHEHLHQKTSRPRDRALGRDEAFLMSRYGVDARSVCRRLWSVWKNIHSESERSRLAKRALNNRTRDPLLRRCEFILPQKRASLKGIRDYGA